MLRRSGATHEVDILYGDEGLPLGIEENPFLTDRKIQLAAGDTLLLVTDGVVEALEANKSVFKLDKLALSLCKADSGASELVESIFEEIGRISPAPPEDDLTVLAVTWTPPQNGVRT
jgi:serine phosphatase RsbU (regulator of sigma subunit)